MSKKIQLTIPEPCHENWQNMIPSERGRFCNACSKQVIDFSRMTDREIAQFFKKPSKGSLCGRFMDEQLNRDLEIPKKRIPWVRYLFQFALPAFLASNKSFAQGEVKKLKGDTILVTKRTVGVISPIIINPAKPSLISGKVIDEKGHPVPHASVILKGTRIGVATNENGEFSFEIKDKQIPVKLIVSSIGFGTLEVQVKEEEGPLHIILPNIELGNVTVGLIITEVKKPVIKKETKKSIPILKQLISDSNVRYFRVFPNPIIAGAEITIEWIEPLEGYYGLELISATGQIKFHKKIWLDKEAVQLDMAFPLVKPGAYFIRVASEITGEHYCEKIIIQ